MAQQILDYVKWEQYWCYECKRYSIEHMNFTPKGECSLCTSKMVKTGEKVEFRNALKDNTL